MKKILLFFILLFPNIVFALSVPSNNAILIDQDTGRVILFSINDNLFDMSKCAGKGNIGHTIEEIKIDMSK